MLGVLRAVMSANAGKTWFGAFVKSDGLVELLGMFSRAAQEAYV